MSWSAIRPAAALALALGTALAGGGASPAGAAPAAAPGELRSPDASFEPAQILASGAPHWKKAPPLTVDLLPQTMAVPMNPSPSTRKLVVQSLHNDRGWIAFKLSWQDTTRDALPRPGQFADAVAIQFPIDAKSPPAPMMGSQRGLVHIIQWRADWQRDVERGELAVKDLYPNAVIDAPADKVYKAHDSVAFSAGREVGNIVSQAVKPRAVQDLMAEGYGSLTTKAVQSADGRGTWKDGRWEVVILRPLEPFNDEAASRLPVKTRSAVGFAVWNGSAGERGSRKAWAPWVPLVIQ